MSLNESVWKFPCFRLWQATELQPNKVYDFFFSTQRCSNIFVFSSHKYVCVWWEISLLPLIPHLSSFIFTPSTHTHTDDPGQLKIYLPKKLLECLPKCSSLPKERHRWNTNEVRLWHTREGNIYDSETNRSPVTHLWQMSHREMKRWQNPPPQNCRYSFYDPKTVTPRNKRYQPKPTKESYSRFTFHMGHFALYSKKLSLGSEIGSRVYKYTGLQGYETRNEATDWMFPLLIVTPLKRPSVS